MLGLKWRLHINYQVMPSILHSKLCNNLTDTRLHIPRRTNIAEEINDASIPFVLLKEHMYARKVCHCFGEYMGELKENMIGIIEISSIWSSERQKYAARFSQYICLPQKELKQTAHEVRAWMGIVYPTENCEYLLIDGLI